MASELKNNLNLYKDVFLKKFKTKLLTLFLSVIIIVNFLYPTVLDIDPENVSIEDNQEVQSYILDSNVMTKLKSITSNPQTKPFDHFTVVNPIFSKFSVVSKI